MSYHMPITFVCDNCSHCEEISLYNSPDLASARKWLATQGWAYQDGKDYCPNCYPPKAAHFETVDVAQAVERVRWILSSGYGDAMDAYNDLRDAVGMPREKGKAQ